MNWIKFLHEQSSLPAFSSDEETAALYRRFERQDGKVQSFVMTGIKEDMSGLCDEMEDALGGQWLTHPKPKLTSNVEHETQKKGC